MIWDNRKQKAAYFAQNKKARQRGLLPQSIVRQGCRAIAADSGRDRSADRKEWARVTPRLCVFDLDETLLNREKKITPELLEKQPYITYTDESILRNCL